MGTNIATKNKITVNLLLIVCALTNLSQMPFFVEHQVTRFISTPLWIILALYCVVKNRGVIRFGSVSVVVLLGCLFSLYYFVVGFFIPAYRDSALPTPILMCVFIAVVGAMLGESLDEQVIQNICTVYIISGLIVCLEVYIRYIYGQSLNGVFYLYASKNSVSQILLTVWILILVLKIGKVGRLKTAAYVAMFAFLTYCLFALKSRASIIGMPIVLICVLLSGKRNKFAKIFVVLFLGTFAVLMLQDGFYDTIVNDILFAGRDQTNLEAITSGRASEWESFWQDLNGNIFFGNGRMKRESIILTALLEFGFLGGSIIFAMVLYPIYWGLRHLSKRNAVQLAFLAVSIVYALNGVFEQQAPFGPGVKCYFLWMMLGILASSSGREESKE